MKLLNRCITVSAVIGAIMIVGSIGKADYMIETGQYYSTVHTALWMLFGAVMCIPAVIRGLF